MTSPPAPRQKARGGKPQERVRVMRQTDGDRPGIFVLEQGKLKEMIPPPTQPID